MMLPVKWPSDPIPPIVHQVWVGTEVPAWVRVLWRHWDEFASDTGLEVRRWTDQEFAGSLTSRIRHPLKPVEQSNFWRLELLALQGGVYMDCDTVPLRPLDDWIGERSGWIGQEKVPEAGNLNFNNATLGFPAGHPFLDDLWQYGVRSLTEGKLGPWINAAGPRAYRQVHRRSGEQWQVEVPRGPFDNLGEARRSLKGLPSPEDLRRDFPDAVVVHLGTVTWAERTESTKWYRKWWDMLESVQ